MAHDKVAKVADVLLGKFSALIINALLLAGVGASTVSIDCLDDNINKKKMYIQGLAVVYAVVLVIATVASFNKLKYAYLLSVLLGAFTGLGLVALAAVLYSDVENSSCDKEKVKNTAIVVMIVGGLMALVNGLILALKVGVITLNNKKLKKLDSSDSLLSSNLSDSSVESSSPSPSVESVSPSMQSPSPAKPLLESPMKNSFTLGRNARQYM